MPEPTDIQPLLDDLRDGKPAAIAELAKVAYDRLRRLAAKMLNESFAAVGKQHDLDSVLNNTYLRLHDSLAKMAVQSKTPPTPADFFRFAAFKIRHVLLDMVGADRRRMQVFTAYGGGTDESWWQPSEDSKISPSPEQKAKWGEFLERVEKLPELERDVLQMHVIMDMSQAQIAKELGVEPKQVSRAWLKAAAAVGQYLPA